MTEAAPAAMPAYYEADAGAVVARVSALPLSVARRLLDEPRTEDQIRLLVQGDSRVLPALQIASPALFEATVRWLAGKPPHGKLLHKLHALLLRMSTRATPFGAYSSVSLMSPNDPALPVCESGLRTTSRPDMEWLHGVVDLAEGKAGSRRNLGIYTNPVHRRRGDYVFVPSLRSGSAGESRALHPPTSLHVTPEIDYCVRAARSGVPWSRLADELAHRFAFAQPAADELIARLLATGLLQTELQPDLLGNPWEAARRAMSRAGTSFWPALADIASELRRFENANLSDWDGRRFAALREKMDAVSTAPQQLQTDATRSVTGSLPARVLQDALCLGELMLRGSPVSGLGRLRARFVESYEGTTRLVPLLEFLDDDSPAATALLPEPSGGSTARTLRLLEMYSRAVSKGDEEIVLSDEQLGELLPPAIPLHELPNAIEVGFSVFARSAAAVAEGEYTIAPASVPGTSGAARTVGRFAHLLSDEQRERAAAARRRSTTPGVLHAELSYHPSKRRLGNVAIRPCDYDFHLCLSHRHEEAGEALDLGDLYVGLDARTHAFYLYSREKQRRVQIETSNVLNVWSESPLVRFLQTLRDDRKRSVSAFDWSSLSFAPTLPRVRYRNLVLSPRRWNVLTAQLRAQELERAVAEWRAAWKVPRVVLLAHGDRRIPCDLESGFGLERIREALSDDALMIEFVEWPAADGTWLSDGETTYCAEFYLTAHRTRVPAEPRMTLAPAAGVPRSFVPGSEWVYADLYEEWGLLDDLLVREIGPFVASLGAAGILERWFFLRYADRKKHLRLRCKSTVAPAELLGRMTAFCKRLSETAAISHYALRTYEREIERYGGTLEAVETAEELFCLDSESALRTIQELQRGHGERAAASIADADDLVRCFVGEDDPRAWFAVPSGAAHKLTAQERVTAKLLSGELLARPWVPPLEMARCAEVYRRLFADGHLSAPIESIFHALLHVHFNRRGIMRADEAAVRRIQRQVYGSVWARSARDGAAWTETARQPDAAGATLSAEHSAPES